MRFFPAVSRDFEGRARPKFFGTQIAIFCILLAIIDFLGFLRKWKAVEENWKAVGEIWKTIGESRKPLNKVRKPLKKAESH
jgi:hypothetical protein